VPVRSRSNPNTEALSSRLSSPQHQVKSATHLPWRIRKCQGRQCARSVAQASQACLAKSRGQETVWSIYLPCWKCGDPALYSANGGAVLAIGRYSQFVCRCVVLQAFTAMTPKKELGGWHIQKRGFGRLGFAKPSRALGMYHLHCVDSYDVETNKCRSLIFKWTLRAGAGV
jgi:hypothetical protein